jgi:hypothetical protein
MAEREVDAGLSRRSVLQAGTGTVAAAGAAALTATGAAAQQLAQGAPNAAPPPAAPNRPIRQGEPNPFYDYSPMPKWPSSPGRMARVAVHLVSNIEHWDVHDNNGRMDVRNLPRKDYGLRVAVWRLFDIFSERRIVHTIALNSAVARFYPEITDAAKARGDEFMGHGITNVERLRFARVGRRDRAHHRRDDPHLHRSACPQLARARTHGR